jgi:hypothetical protein
MSKPSQSRRTAKRSAGSKAAHTSAINDALRRLEAISTDDPKTAAVVRLLRSWLQDSSGYDERTWPELKKSLDKERRLVRARSLFDG